MASPVLNSPDAIVIGAGCAGLSAASRLATAGRRVLVFEARGRLGGRATAFVDRASGEPVDNGQHILIGCYRDTLAFLEEIGAGANVEVADALAVTMVDLNGTVTRLACGPGSLPRSLALGLWRWPALSWADRWSATRVARPIRAAARGRIHAFPDETVDQWLTRHRQSARLREMLWYPLALAAMNEPPEVAAAAPFLRVLGEMFGGRDRRAAALVLPRKPLHELYAEPARRYVEARGGSVRTGMPAHVRIENGVPAVAAGDTTWRGVPVVVAVPWFVLPTLFSGDTAPLSALLSAAAATGSSAIATVNLWFDRPVMSEAVIGLPGRTMQWVFDKRYAFGATASHLTLVSSGAGSVARRTNAELLDLARREVADALPATRDARLINATIIREPRATFSVAPNQPARPRTATAVPDLFLAGDWIETGLPATIESAVRSGHLAAAAVLAQDRPTSEPT